MRSFSESYRDAGVNIEAGYEGVKLMKKHVQRTMIPGVVSDIGGFGGLFAPDLTGMSEPVLVSGTDGVGTKQRIAQLMNKHDSVGIDCVAMCVNDIICCGAKPIFFLDYIAIGKNEPEKVATLVSGVAEGCVQSGCALIGGEMAEHPGVMRPDDYDLAGFTVGVVDRPKMIDPANVREGDVIIGLPSTGVHSNGYSLVRKVIGVDGIVPGTPEAEAKKAELESIELAPGLSLADGLLAPTRIYVKPILELLRGEAGKHVHAVAHITGGGITENLNRALPANVDALVERDGSKMGWDIPAVITYVSESAELTPNEACKTFNMGVGLMLIVSAEDESAVTEALVAMGEKPFRVGTCIAGSGEVKYTDEQ